MRLAAQGITVTADGRAIVDAADLAVAPGELVGLIGPNGAGKSTLLRAVVGVRAREAGAITIGEERAEALPPRERARRLAYLPQERRVEWRLSVNDVVMLGRFPHRRSFGGRSEADRAAVERALAAMDAGALAGREAASLSGGELARVLLARALAVEAPILLADEPIAGLDPYHQLHVMEALQAEARRGRGVLAVLHDLALAARFMDRLVLMSGGRVVADGPPEQVLANETLAAVYHVATLGGQDAGRRWVIPWERLSRGEGEGAAAGRASEGAGLGTRDGRKRR
jgi:iron complex transport system ATP-binding protein